MELVSGLRAVGGEPSLRLVVGLLSAGSFVEGAVDVLIVLLAVELLDIGGQGVGWLNAAWGIGGLVAGAAAIALLGRGRLASRACRAVACWRAAARYCSRRFPI